MSDFDLTSMVDYALETTNAAQLIYIGHSQGTMIQFAQLSKNSAFAAKIKLFIALGPVVHVGHIESPIRVLGKKGEVHTFTYIHTQKNLGLGFYPIYGLQISHNLNQIDNFFRK